MSEELKPCPPVLVRDLAEILGRAVPDVMSAFIVAGLAPHSPNMAVSGEDALAVAAVLKQQRQDCEPVAWQARSIKGGDWGPPITSKRIADEIASDGKLEVRPLYAAPPKREPLSVEEILRCPWDSKKRLSEALVIFSRALEAKHGIGGQS